MTQETVSIKEAVQIRLGAQLATDSGLRAQLENDPDSVIKPIIAELLGDDGEIDLTDVTTTVHIESGNDLHFVVAPEAVELDEVAGFAAEPLSMSGLIGSFDIGIGDIGGDLGIKKRTEGGRCTNSGHRGTKCCYI
jgi:hypothetical protein